MNRRLAILATMFVALVAVPLGAAPAVAQQLPANLDKANALVIDTTKGRIVIKLRTDLAPQHAERLKQLAREGFYNNVPFHRVMDGFMIQGGDPLGTGTGGPGYQFNDEIHPELNFNDPYLLAMANAGKRMGKGTNGSQFFITVAPTPWLLGNHTIFGKVADEESKRVVDAIATTPTGAQDRPVTEQVINSIEIVD